MPFRQFLETLLGVVFLIFGIAFFILFQKRDDPFCLFIFFDFQLVPQPLIYPGQFIFTKTTKMIS